jgi:hypothetical protein
MAKNMSFALTTKQIRERTKTVTRRLAWKSLRAGQYVNAVVKTMGLKKGDRIMHIARLKIIDVRREPLWQCTDEEAAKEGFPGMTGSDFVKMFCKHMGGTPGQDVTRIEFEYVD